MLVRQAVGVAHFARDFYTSSHRRAGWRRETSGDRRDGIEGDATYEYSQATEQSLLLGTEQVVTPAHRRLQALLPCWQVCPLPAQEVQSVRQPPRDHGKG